MSDLQHRPEMDDAPPILGSWPRLYAWTAVALTVFILLGWWLTEAYA